MDYELPKLILMSANVLLTICVWLKANGDNKDKATKSSIDRVEESFKTELKAVEYRVNALESHIGGLPSHNDLVRLHERIDVLLKGQAEANMLLGDVAGQLKQVSHNRWFWRNR